MTLRTYVHNLYKVFFCYLSYVRCVKKNKENKTKVCRIVFHIFNIWVRTIKKRYIRTFLKKISYWYFFKLNLDVRFSRIIYMNCQ